MSSIKVLQVLDDLDFVTEGGPLLVSNGDATWLDMVVPPLYENCSHLGWNPESQWCVFEVKIERYKLVLDAGKPYLVPFDYNPSTDTYETALHSVWFWDDGAMGLQDVAENFGYQGCTELVGMLASEDIAERALAYVAIGDYHGWDNFDSEPLLLSEHEMHARYDILDECTCTECRNAVRKEDT